MPFIKHVSKFLSGYSSMIAVCIISICIAYLVWVKYIPHTSIEEYTPKYMRTLQDQKYKVVVFDFDETLGHFVQLSDVIYLMETIKMRNLKSNEYGMLFYLFPKYLRPEIVKILKFLGEMKRKKRCKIMVFTNNQGGKKWVRNILNAIENYINEPDLFDKIVNTYAIGREIIEKCRTSHDKIYEEFLTCTKLPQNTKVIFIDDVLHPKMDNDHVTYIHVDPYIHKYTKSEIFQTLITFRQLDQRKRTELYNILPHVRGTINTKEKIYNDKNIGDRLHNIIRSELQ